MVSLQAVVIGASAGGIEALAQLLPWVPANCRVPIIVVVHLPPDQPSLLAELSAGWCALPARTPLDKEPASGGIVWYAPPDYHLMVEEDHTFSLSVDPPVNHSRPSIDVLFESAADAYGRGVLAIVLTGANEDGATGARAVQQAGGTVIVQEPSTALAPRMPEAAIASAQPQLVADIRGLGEYLRARCTG